MISHCTNTFYTHCIVCWSLACLNSLIYCSTSCLIGLYTWFLMLDLLLLLLEFSSSLQELAVCCFRIFYIDLLLICFFDVVVSWFFCSEFILMQSIFTNSIHLSISSLVKFEFAGTFLKSSPSGVGLCRFAGYVPDVIPADCTPYIPY